MFIGRNNELKCLKKLYDNNHGAKLGVLYGRRRIGKSSLITEAFKNKNAIYIEGLENLSATYQIASFFMQLQKQINNPNIKKVKTWSELLIQLPDIIGNKKYVLVLDELQWLSNYKSQFISELKMVWDNYLSKIDGFVLILCGSIASFMVKKVIDSKALYGRVDLEINLSPFLLNETKEMLQNKGVDEILEAQILLGGVPLYLKHMAEFSSVQQAAQELCFTENGLLFNEFDRIFISHFGSNKHYKEILTILCKHQKGLTRKEITNLLKISAGGEFSGLLFDLEKSGFIKSRAPLDKNKDSPLAKYYPSDAFIMFYLKFIEPNKNKIKSKQQDLFYRIAASNEYKSYLGQAFEYVCWNHSHKIAELLGFSGINYLVGPYFKRKNSTFFGFEIDLMYKRADNVIVLCEIKYTTGVIGLEIINEIDKKTEQLSQIFLHKTILKVLIIKGKVSEELNNKKYFYRIIKAEELIL